jgi:hypothetical protein
MGTIRAVAKGCDESPTSNRLTAAATLKQGVKRSPQSRPDGRDGIDQLVDHSLPLARDLLVLQGVERKGQIIRTKPIPLEDRHQANVVAKGLPVFSKVKQGHFALLVPPQCFGHLGQRFFLCVVAEFPSLLEEATALAEPFVAFVSGQFFERFVAVDQGVAVAVPRGGGQLDGHLGQLLDVEEEVEEPSVSDGIELGGEPGVELGVDGVLRGDLWEVEG